MSTVSQCLSFRGVVSEAKRVTTAHSRHFYALSLFFLFPLCFAINIYPSLLLFTASSQLNGFHPQQWLFSFTADPRARSILLALLFNLLALCLAPCALGTIIYSTFNGHYGRPVTLSSSIKSLFYSFLPILSTLIVSQIIVCFIAIVFGVLAALLLTGLQIVGLEVNYNSIYFWALVISLVLLLVLVILWLQINWSLAYVIVVVESKWGYEPLLRSAQLVKGMRWVASSILLLYGLVFSLMVVTNSAWLGMIGANRGLFFWTVAIMVVNTSSLVSQLALHSLSANVVLYIYCKALHEKIALLEIAEVDGGKDATSLPFGGGEVSQVVNHV